VRLLLDTHAFLWWLTADPRQSAAAGALIAEPANQVFVSAASAWEITTKYRLGKLPETAGPVAVDVAAQIAREGFNELAVSVAHAQHAGAMAGSHKDPFDRLLAAQAILENMLLISNDAAVDGLGVYRLW
jgi:PIN domain nuclease of toxin-antitoxin system